MKMISPFEYMLREGKPFKFVSSVVCYFIYEYDDSPDALIGQKLKFKLLPPELAQDDKILIPDRADLADYCESAVKNDGFNYKVIAATEGVKNKYGYLPENAKVRGEMFTCDLGFLIDDLEEKGYSLTERIPMRKSRYDKSKSQKII